MDRRAFVLGAPALLAACSTKPRVFADAADVANAFAPNDGPPLIELFTVFNVSSGSGAHSALFINADQRVLFDAAGTFALQRLPERHDVIYGMTPAARRLFINYHTRVTYWTATQTFEVPNATARWILNAAEQAGPVPDALCTRSISTILAAAPGLPFQVERTFFPEKLHAQLLGVPGVTRQEYRDDDADDNSSFLETATL